MRFEQMTVDVLAQTPGGAALAQYFGIASTPRQSPEAARRATCLLNMQTNGGPQVFANLDQEIARHNAASGVDPDVLRALMFRFSSRAA